MQRTITALENACDALSVIVADSAAARLAEEYLRDEIKELISGTVCPGCVKCGPPIVVKADEGCDGSGLRGVNVDAGSG